jgi:hypothetical protein
MHPITTIRFSMISLVLSISTLLAIIWINWNIAEYYNSLGRKEQAWFGLTEALNYSYKYFFLAPALIALILALVGRKRKEVAGASVTAIVLSLITVISVLVKLWKVMI